MPPVKDKSFNLSGIWSHLIVAGVTAFVSFFSLTISYKEKIDNLIAQTLANQVSIQRLTDVVNAQTVQITELKTELQYINKVAQNTSNRKSASN